MKARAHGRCEYCLIDQSDTGFPHEVDHIISRKHGGESDLDNLAFACYLCNRYKGSDIASLDSLTHKLIRLFHPRQDRWEEHFRINGAIPEPLTPTGAATAGLLRLNTAPRVVERQMLQSLTRYPTN